LFVLVMAMAGRLGVRAAPHRGAGLGGVRAGSRPARGWHDAAQALCPTGLFHLQNTPLPMSSLAVQPAFQPCVLHRSGLPRPRVLRPRTRRGAAWAVPTLLLALAGGAGLTRPAQAQAQAQAQGPAAGVEAAAAPASPVQRARTPTAAAAVASYGPDSPEAQGALLYHNYCSVCHGDRGDGRSRATGALSTPPRDFTSPASRAELTPERIVRAVTYGRPGTAMVGWTRQLSPTDIERVADHVWRRFVQAGPAPALAGRPAGHPPVPGQAGPGSAAAAPGTGGISGTQAHGGREVDAPAGMAPPAAPAGPGAAAGGVDLRAARTNPALLLPVPAAALDPKLGLPLGLKGDVKRGGAYYRANCVACHGSKGDGQGPRAYFINPPPRNFIDPATRSRLNRPLLYASIHAGRPGTEMPAWSKVASDQQIADVAEYVFRSFVLGGPQPAGVAASAARP
jgi:mono/diheme cytochrome c family protein